MVVETIRQPLAPYDDASHIAAISNVNALAPKIHDQTAEKIAEDFFNFLDTFVAEDSMAISAAASAATSTGIMSSGADAPMTAGLMSDGTLHIAPPPASTTVPEYVRLAVEMYEGGANTLFVSFSHLLQYSDVLANAVAEGYYRFEPYLREAVFQLVHRHIRAYATVGSTDKKREFFVGFHALGLVHRLRDLQTQLVGQLLAVSGTVTRTSEVRPELLSGTFQCLLCGAVVRNVTQQFKYTEPTICANRTCSNKLEWRLIAEQSLFVDWQKVRIQENANEIPAGSMPRTMDVVVRNDIVEVAKPGDKIDVTGCLIVVPDVSQMSLPASRIEQSASANGGRSQFPAGADGVTGIKGLGVRELSYRLAFLGCMVQRSADRSNAATATAFGGAAEVTDGSATPIDPTTLFTPAELLDIERMRRTPNLYQKLVDSFAPAIYGHAEIKAGILLMLFGGVHKCTHEGISLRGDINICIVGDPGTAKSQFLKYVTSVMPRSVFTSGKASSAAGLTASVMKDEESGEFTVEAGALMLADNGICAIDEFDKMDIADQIAIHEAMEQQTISIAKAGIQATLNARTSILAAANPVGGRYDRKKSLRQNIAMSAPIMSRFDLFFVLLDECNESSDACIARHVLAIHRHRSDAVDPEFSIEQIARYIRYARTIRPKLTSDAADLLVARYKQARQNDEAGGGASYRMTVRQLESMIRLSEALARMHADSEIKVKYVQEACRFLRSSIMRVDNDVVYLDIDRNEHAAASTEASTQPKEQLGDEARTALPFDEYMRICNMLIYRLRRCEEAATADGDGDVGVKRSALVDWYLEQIEDQIATEQELVARHAQVNAVIERLVHHDSVLIAVSAEDGAADDALLVVHPNYVPSS